MTPSASNRCGVLTSEQSAQVDALRERLDELASVPLPGRGATLDRWRFFADVGRRDLSHARLVEGHLDALAILHELGRADLIEPNDAWGVWAAQPDRLTAVRSNRGWHLSGTKSWCSGSIGLDVALLTATSPNGPRLFAVEPAQLEVDRNSWEPIGMAGTASHTMAIDVWLPVDSAVGSPGSYVARPGFWHGGAGVAACWYGGAEAVLGRLADRVDPARSALRRDADTVAFGRARIRLDAAAALLRSSAAGIDECPVDVASARRRALGVRLAVEDAARLALEVTNVALGAGELCAATPHSRHVADLTVYLRQLDVVAAAIDVADLAASDPVVGP